MLPEPTRWMPSWSCTPPPVSLPRSGAGLDSQQYLTDVADVARSDEELAHDAGAPGGHLEGRLLALDLDERIVRADLLADRHVHGHDVDRDRGHAHLGDVNV